MQDPSDRDIDRMLGKWAGSESGAALPPELQQKVLGMLTPSLTLVKPVPRQSVLVLGFLGVLIVSDTGLVAILSKAGFHLMTGAQIGWMALIVAGAAILFAVTLAGQMVPGRKQHLPFFLVFGLSAAGVIAGIALNFPWRITSAFVAEGWPCAVMELAMALPAAVVFWLLARRGALFASSELGAALAGLAVFLALTPLQFQCMFPQAPHLLAWHAGTAALLTAAGALIGSI